MRRHFPKGRETVTYLWWATWAGDTAPGWKTRLKACLHYREYVPTGENNPVTAANIARSNSGVSFVSREDDIRVSSDGLFPSDPTLRVPNASALICPPRRLNAGIRVPATHSHPHARLVDPEGVAGAMTTRVAVAKLMSANQSATSLFGVDIGATGSLCQCSLSLNQQTRYARRHLSGSERKQL